LREESLPRAQARFRAPAARGNDLHCKRLKRCGVRVPIAIGLALFASAAAAPIQLLAHGRNFCDIIQERNGFERRERTPKLLVRYQRPPRRCCRLSNKKEMPVAQIPA